MTETNTSAILRRPPYTYLHLSPVSDRSDNFNNARQSQSTPLDAITLLTHLQSALNQSFGLTGTAIPIDVLLIENQDAWIRVPYDDGSNVTAALTQWSSPTSGIALRVLGRGEWLGGLIRRQKKQLWNLG